MIRNFGAPSVVNCLKGLRSLSILFLPALLVCAAPAFAQSPRIFFTDITSGPNSGGESVSGYSGAYVTIYGNYFGASQGSSTVTLNGANCLRVVSWGTSWLWYQKVVVQLGSSCASGTGDFVVTVNGQPSTHAVTTYGSGTIDGASFTVRTSGSIYCVAASGGSDSNAGTFSGGCWSTMQHAANTMKGGDITYVKNGVNEGYNCSSYNAAVCLPTNSGASATTPVALVAYPGATVTVNDSHTYSMRSNYPSGGRYWVVAGFSMTETGNGEALKLYDGTTDMRIVANTLSCPNSYGTAACTETEGSGGVGDYLFYGNTWTNIGAQVSGQKTYHALYFSTNDDHSDVGWNLFQNIHGCRAFQVYDSTGRDTGDLHIHDNTIHDVVCDAINFNGVNPDETGGVEAYNNIMYNVGIGPDPPDGAADYACVNTGANSSHSNPVLVYANTCYNAGFKSSAGGVSGAFQLAISTKLTNNLVYENNSQPYLAGNSGCNGVASGSSSNDWYGNGASPTCSNLSSSKNSNPLVVSTTTPDFHLQSSSPLIAAGAALPSLTGDHDGVTRPQTGYDIGGYQFFQGTTPPASNSCDLNSDGVVNTSDVMIAINQALGTAPCTNANLSQDGCTVVDVQRVVNASLGQTCRVGQ